MIRLRIVKSVKNDDDHQDDRENLTHGKQLLKELVIPYANIDSIVCADSHFASVPAAE